MVTKYGMISDIHKDPRVIVPAFDALKNQGVNKIIVNGDIGGNYGSLEQSQGYTAFILEQIGKSGIETFVQPGSHETLFGYMPVVEHFSEKFSNVIDCLQTSKVEDKDHSLVFLPGSDFLCGGEFQIGNDERIPTGNYINLDDGRLGSFTELQDYADALKKGIVKGAFRYSNMNDLKKSVTDPDKTIVVCHVPRKFYGDDCIDMAEFGDVVETFRTQNRVTEKGSVIPLQFVQPYIDAGAPVVIKKENRGNKDLMELYDEIGIRKAVSGHFHESGHRANDANSKYVPENEFVEELFWNSGCLDQGQFGILSVDGNHVSYQNIELK